MKQFTILMFCLLMQNLHAQTKVEKRIDSLFNSFLKDNEPGGAVLIFQNGKTIFSKGYGIEDITTKKPITVHSIFNTGSISKTFVSNAILILFEKKN
jgi:CubicO group peptidase (beta-lactamase class C family)